jgi:hypothetical protein
LGAHQGHDFEYLRVAFQAHTMKCKVCPSPSPSFLPSFFMHLLLQDRLPSLEKEYETMQSALQTKVSTLAELTPNLEATTKAITTRMDEVIAAVKTKTDHLVSALADDKNKRENVLKAQRDELINLLSQNSMEKESIKRFLTSTPEDLPSFMNLSEATPRLIPTTFVSSSFEQKLDCSALLDAVNKLQFGTSRYRPGSWDFELKGYYECLDTNNHWEGAQILDIRLDFDSPFFVHYTGWKSKLDVWVKAESLRPLGTTFNQTEVANVLLGVRKDGKFELELEFADSSSLPW